MVTPHVLLASSLIFNTALAAGCASSFGGASTPIAETYHHLSDQAGLSRQEAVDLRAAAQYYEGEAQRSEREARPESERARRYRDFSQEASAQAEEAERSADEYQRQLQSL
jgi:hypothetical protein